MDHLRKLHPFSKLIFFSFYLEKNKTKCYLSIAFFGNTVRILKKMIISYLVEKYSYLNRLKLCDLKQRIDVNKIFLLKVIIYFAMLFSTVADIASFLRQYRVEMFQFYFEYPFSDHSLSVSFILF